MSGPGYAVSVKAPPTWLSFLISCLYVKTGVKIYVCTFISHRHHHENFVGYQDDNLFQDEMRYLRSTSVPAPYISVTPDACPNVFEEPENNMKSMPPRYF